ncbi:translational machinery protein [Afipia sp. Root123D2]|uniref:hypothetical protein n=1 Tax=Afipia sp. Root123D2 TaxID=1736436 RepID=UPI0006F1C396|nr:hypothetical protein [Afipia sp. Root123D2]KQW22005.1 translational machinery protein [Afipia sp. Root123D2]
MPTHLRAIVCIDHSQVRLHIGLSGEEQIVPHPHLPTRHLHHKANTIGSGHAAPDLKFLAQVRDAVRGAAQILIIGPSTARTELAKCFHDQDSKIGHCIVAVEAADHPSDGEIVAYARHYFGIGPARAGAITG